MTTEERHALLLATVAHGILFAALSLSLARLPPLKPAASTAIPIEYVAIDTEPTVTARNDAPAPAIPAPAEETPPPPADEPDTATDEAVQDSVVDEVSEIPAPEKPKPTPKPAPKPADSKAPPKKTETKKAERFDAGALASLIDKALPRAAPKAAGGGPTGRVSARQVATLEQAIRAQIAPCWNPPTGGADVQDMSAILELHLNRDGSMASPPVFLSQKGVKPGREAYARAFVESARRAVLRCTPLKLPDDLYPLWKTFELNFDPRIMT